VRSNLARASAIVPIARLYAARLAAESALGFRAVESDVRRVVPAMRWVFVVGSMLVTAAAVQLFILTDSTDRFFAWTISSGLSAAFLGGFYFTAFVLAAGSATRSEWAQARVGVFGVWLFVTLTLVATLLHLDKFHFHDPSLIPRGAAWLWTIIYVVEPVAVLAAIVLQLRAPGDNRPREHLLPIWYRIAVAAQWLVLLTVGLWLFFAPGSVDWWPWTLTPLVARAMGAWLLGLSVVLASAAWENDWSRIRIATSSYLALGVLQFVAVARYASDLRGGTETVLYLAFLAIVVATGASGAVFTLSLPRLAAATTER
jgi:hypothetical protein